jgi:hypothetical protein
VEPIAKSGLHYPNQIVRIYYQTIEEIMGKNGLGAVMKLAHLNSQADDFPPDNLNAEFDFADYSSLHGALDELYGARGGRTLALRAARAAFRQGLGSVGPLTGASNPAFKDLSLAVKLKFGLLAMAVSFSQISDQRAEVEDANEAFYYSMAPCPVCWGRTSSAPICHSAAAQIEEGLRYLSGGRDFRVIEDRCLAKGDAACRFVVPKEPAG